MVNKIYYTENEWLSTKSIGELVWFEMIESPCFTGETRSVTEIYIMMRWVCEITLHTYHPEYKQTTSASNAAAHLMGKEPFLCLCNECFYSNISKSLNIKKDRDIWCRNPPLQNGTGTKLHVWKYMIYNCHRNITFKHTWSHD